MSTEEDVANDFVEACDARDAAGLAGTVAECIKTLAAQTRALEDEVAALKARQIALEGALKPFAAVAVLGTAKGIKPDQEINLRRVQAVWLIGSLRFSVFQTAHALLETPARTL